MALMEEGIDQMVSSEPIQREGPVYKFVESLPGHESPRIGAESPDTSYYKIYEVFKGYGIWRSMSRLSKFYVNEREFSEVLDEYKSIRKSDPSDGKYVDLARAVAKRNDVDFEHEKTSYGHLIRVWDEDEVEWQLPVRRGEHKKHEQSEAYKRALDVDNIDETQHMSYKEVKNVKAKNFEDVSED